MPDDEPSPQELADIERARIEEALPRIDDYRAGRTKARPVDEVFAELRSQKSEKHATAPPQNDHETNE